MQQVKNYHQEILFSIIFLIAYVQLNAQIDYSTYKEDEKVTVFRDEFNNNGNGWVEGGSKIQYGLFNFGGFSNGYEYTNVSLFFDDKKDYEIETSIIPIITTQSNKSNRQNTFDWGKYSWGFGETRGITLYLDYTPIKYFDTELKKSSFNKLTIRKIGGIFYCFVNEKYIGKSESDIFGSQEKIKVGFSGSYFSVDYLKIYSLSKNPPIVNQVPPTIPNRTNSAAYGIQIQDQKKRGKEYGLIIGVS